MVSYLIAVSASSAMQTAVRRSVESTELLSQRKEQNIDQEKKKKKQLKGWKKNNHHKVPGKNKENPSGQERKENICSPTCDSRLGVGGHHLTQTIKK